MDNSASHRILARYLGMTVAMEFDSPEAMKKYLEDHPGADKANHTVKKPGGEGGSSKGKAVPSHRVQQVHDAVTKELDRIPRMESDMSADDRRGVAKNIGGHLKSLRDEAGESLKKMSPQGKIPPKQEKLLREMDSTLKMFGGSITNKMDMKGYVGDFMQKLEKLSV